MSTAVIPEKSTCIKVCARFRPTNSREKEEKAETVVNFDNSNRAVNLKLENDSHDFTFDAVFPPESTQLGVFEETGKKLVPQLLNGYNCTVFAYGQTGGFNFGVGESLLFLQARVKLLQWKESWGPNREVTYILFIFSNLM